MSALKALGWGLLVLVVFVLWSSGSADELATQSGGSGATTAWEDPTLDDGFDEDYVEEEPVEETWTPPEGFTVWREDPLVAYRWLSGDLDCPSYSDGCWQIEVIARDGCPDGLYAAMNKIGANDTVVGYTNDSLPAIEAGQRARLTFTASADDGEAKGRVAEIHCR